ncbi:MAG TPA: hypothetical protein PLL92_03730 [Alicycliphilus sp.]|nr:hypothetical protein [Alicycliphilus sp.]
MSFIDAALREQNEQALKALVNALVPKAPPEPALLREAAMLARSRKAVLEGADGLTAAELAGAGHRRRQRQDGRRRTCLSRTVGQHGHGKPQQGRTRMPQCLDFTVKNQFQTTKHPLNARMREKPCTRPVPPLHGEMPDCPCPNARHHAHDDHPRRLPARLPRHLRPADHRGGRPRRARAG